MAAQITVTYTPGFTSTSSDSPFICHRICYRQVGQPEYCCVEDTTDSYAGVLKTFVIDIDAGTSPLTCISVIPLDPESCANTEYEGYVQACCESGDSTAGRVNWISEFVADPSCVNRYTCCVASVGLTDPAWFVITNPGSGYTPLSTLPVIVLRDPLDTETSDATVTIDTDAGGVVTSIQATVAGLYNKIPQLILPSPGGGGTQATAILQIPCVKEGNSFKDDCVDDGIGTETVLLLGQCAQFCYPKSHPYIYTQAGLITPNTTDFSYLTQGCCDCTTCGDYTIIISTNLPSIDVCYTVCSYKETPSAINCKTLAGSGSYNLTCVVPGSIYCPDDENAIVSITYNNPGTCCIS